MSDQSISPAHAASANKAAKISAPRMVVDQSDGGHEVDKSPNKALFIFLASVVAFVIFGSIGTVQLQNNRVDSLRNQFAGRMETRLATLQAKEQEILSTYGALTDDEGAAIGYRIPVDAARELVLKDNSRFKAATPGPDWVHPDGPN